MSLGPAPDVRVPDGITPVTGYRLFRVSPSWRTLLSLGAIPWNSTKPTTARCLVLEAMGSPGHQPETPAEDCGCGLYAMKSLDAVVKAYEPVRRRHMPVMFASVLLWGKVVEAERGYRAQYGRVAQLMPTPLQDAMAEALSARYGVPISDRVRRSWLVDGPMHDSPLPRIIVLVDAERIEFPGCPYLAPSGPGRWRVQLPPGGETPGKPRSGGRDVIEQLIQGAFAADIEFLRCPQRLMYRLDPDDGVWRFERVTGDCRHEPATN